MAKEAIQALLQDIEEEMTAFAQDLVKTRSCTGEEEQIVRLIQAKMIALGYDDAVIDDMGNAIGVVGHGDKRIMFDGHVDTVGVNDAREWSVDPFGGTIAAGKLFGRGAADMKSAVAAAVYAGYAVKKLNLDHGKTVYISASVLEEDYEGEAVLHACTKGGIKPDYVVICEPSQCRLSLGQKGRALIRIDLKGVSAHGSAPEKGVNPVYPMAGIMQRVEALGKAFMASENRSGSIAITGVETRSASLNAIPSKCSIYLDRRLLKGEDQQAVAHEINTLIKGTNATWEIVQVPGKSWTGKAVVLDSFLPAWQIEPDHELATAAVRSFEDLFGTTPQTMTWDFSTNGVATMSRLGIPTIGFGPGDSKLAHCVDEYCPVEEIGRACMFYTNLVRFL